MLLQAGKYKIIFRSRYSKHTTESREVNFEIKANVKTIVDLVEIKKGTGAYKFAVFTDPDCPYCKALEQDLAKNEINDYTAYVFLYPLKQIHPDAAARSESIWCSKDKTDAWTNWMVKGINPAKTTCENPVSQNIKLAEDLGVNGTPSIYLEDGHQAQNLKNLIDKIKSNK